MVVTVSVSSVAIIPTVSPVESETVATTYPSSSMTVTTSVSVVPEKSVMVVVTVP